VDRTVSGQGTIQKVATEAVFRATNGTGAETTSYAYEWYSGTMQPSKVTTTLPVVSQAQGGTGVATTTEKHYDEDGDLIASVDGVGTVTTFMYDKLRRAVIQKVEDSGPGRFNL